MRTRVRVASLDNLKVVLITLIIVLHAALGYASFVEVWTYTELRETTLSTATQVVLLVLVAPAGFFLIGLLFLVAGLFAPGSLDRKGPARFTRDRLLRLGVPYVFFVLVVQPVVTYVLGHPLGDAPGSYWDEYLAEGEGHRLDSGPLWFVGTLLVFSLAYAGWSRVSRGSPPSSRLPHELTGRHLALLAVGVAVISMGIRVGWPYGSEAGVLDLNYWEWPACAAMFGLGIAGAGRGWREEVPAKLVRTSRAATLGSGAAMVVLLATAGLRDEVDQLMGGAHMLAVAFAVVDSVLVVFGSLWMLALTQRHLATEWRWTRPLARLSFGAFFLQSPVLIGLALALRPVELPAEAKFLLVATLGVVLSYATAHVLITRVPGADRVL